MTRHVESDDWYTLDTLTFMDWTWYNDPSHTVTATMKVVEGFTKAGEIVEVVYYAAGDYEDRWVDVTGKQRDIMFWRPCR